MSLNSRGVQHIYWWTIPLNIVSLSPSLTLSLSTGFDSLQFRIKYSSLEARCSPHSGLYALAAATQHLTKAVNDGAEDQGREAYDDKRENGSCMGRVTIAQIGPQK